MEACACFTDVFDFVFREKAVLHQIYHTKRQKAVCRFLLVRSDGEHEKTGGRRETAEILPIFYCILITYHVCGGYSLTWDSRSRASRGRLSQGHRSAPLP